MEGFTRQETIALTRTTSSRLAYLDRTSVIVPQKYGNSKKPTVIYTWEQVMEIRAISNLRQKISLQMVRKIVQFLDAQDLNSSLHDKHLVATDNEVFLVMPDWSDMPHLMKVADRQNQGVGQLVLLVLPPLSDVIQDIWDAAKASDVINFESFKERAKALPAEAS
ncbi:MAG: MerR family transcriptional regulator [Cyanobacteria bacterium J06642_9]